MRPRRSSALHLVSFVVAGVTALGCAPVTWETTSTSSVSARTLSEEPPRRDPARDVLEVGVEPRGEHTLVRVSRIAACSSEVKELVTVEKVSRAEPDPAFIALDHVALIGGAVAAGFGAGLAVACSGKSGGGCDAVVPILGGGIATELLGVVGRAVDSGKRRTERVPHQEQRSFGFTTRECARSPVAGIDVSLVPDTGHGASARTDDSGNADIVLGAHGPIDVDVRIDGHSVRRQRLP